MEQTERKKLLTEIMQADAKDGLYEQPTAVQSFWNKIALQLSVEQINKFLPEFEQAKAMEKEQMETSFIEGAEMAKKVFTQELKEFIVLPKDYINETYNK